MCFRAVVDGKVELIVTVHHIDDIVMAGSDETCRGGLPCHISYNFPKVTSGNKFVYGLRFQVRLGIESIGDFAEGVH